MLPEFRILSYLLLVVSVYLFPDMTLYLIAGLFMALFLLRLPMKRILSGWLPILFLAGITLLGNLFHQPGRILLATGSLTITDQGVMLAGLRTLRLLLLIAGVKLLIGGVRPEDLVRGLETLCRPAERAGLPVKDFFHIMGLTIACFPLLKETMSAHYRMQIDGHRDQGLHERIQAVGAFLLPVFVESLRSPEAYFERTPHHGETV